MEPLHSLLSSAASRIKRLQEEEFTPQAELAQLELLLALALMQFTTDEEVIDNVLASS